MILKKATTLLLLSLFGVISLWSQPTHDPQSIIASIVEDLVASSEDDIDIDALTEDLIFFSENPINLNSATSEELGRLVFLSDFQVIALLDYVKKHGHFITIYELQLVVGFDFNDIFKLTPFVTIEPLDKPASRIPFFKYGKHDLFMRARTLIETPEGYKPPPESNPGATRYAGNKLGLYTRYTYTNRRGFQAGFVGEKDPGEDFFRGSNPYGFDHYSFHLQANDIGRIKTLVVGDFNADFGQGLTLRTSASFGKSSDPMSVRKRSRGLYRFSSTNENEFLRGAGATVKIGLFDISAFGSYKKIDANITDTLYDGTMVFTSRPTSGLHRTPTEINNKKTLGETVAGGNVSISWKNLKAGITGSYVNLNGEFDVPNQPYRYFEPSLNNRKNIGIDYNLGVGNHLLFGEAATTIGHGSGILSGGLFRVHSLLSLSIVGRHYQKDYSTYYTGALADGSSAANESGILTGIKFLPYRHWQVAGYVDVFQSSWLRYGINAPSRGKDFLLETTYSPRSRLSFIVRYKFKQKEKNQDDEGSNTRWVVPYNQQSLRFHLAYNPTRAIHLRSRIEFSWYEEENRQMEKGIMVYQDISYRPANSPLTITTRFAVFETDSYNTRIYAYENDVLYYFSIPAYYSRGTRAYLLAKYSVGRKMDIWFRVAQTFFADQNQLGSGLDLINGPTRSDARIQIRLKF
jgi:hypothetical protein